MDDQTITIPTVDARIAVQAFADLDQERYEVDDRVFPLFNVRLDAGTSNRADDRFYRLFVRMDPNAPHTVATGALQKVLDVAKRHDLTAISENSGIELS